MAEMSNKIHFSPKVLSFALSLPPFISQTLLPVNSLAARQTVILLPNVTNKYLQTSTRKDKNIYQIVMRLRVSGDKNATMRKRGKQTEKRTGFCGFLWDAKLSGEQLSKRQQKVKDIVWLKASPDLCLSMSASAYTIIQMRGEIFQIWPRNVHYIYPEAGDHFPGWLTHFSADDWNGQYQGEQIKPPPII